MLELGPPSPLTFHNVKNHGGRENCQGTKNKRKQRKQHKTNRKKTTKKDTWGGKNKIVRVFWTFSQKHGLCPFRCLGVFWCFGMARLPGANLSHSKAALAEDNNSPMESCARHRFLLAAADDSSAHKTLLWTKSIQSPLENWSNLSINLDLLICPPQG